MISDDSLREVSCAHIAAHVSALEGVRHPVVAPGALEQAADYLTQSLSALGYQMSEQLFRLAPPAMRAPARGAPTEALAGRWR